MDPEVYKLMTLENIDPMFTSILRPTLVDTPKSLAGEWEPPAIPEHHNAWTVPWNAYNSVLGGILEGWGDIAPIVVAHLTITRKEWESGEYSEDLVRVLEHNIGRTSDYVYCMPSNGPHYTMCRTQHHHMMGGDGTRTEVRFDTPYVPSDY